MAAVAPLPQTEWVRLGSLVVRTDVNHREHRNKERIQEYVRMLESGTNPPAIKVHRGSNTVLDGIHRVFAAKTFAYSVGRKWQDHLIEVEWTDDTPDPDGEPELFAVRGAAENRYNGEPLDRRDVLRLVAAVVKKHGKEKGREAALQMNETETSFEEFYRSLYPAPPQRTITTRQVASPGEPQVFVTGEFEEAKVPNRAEVVNEITRSPGPLNINEMRSTRPPIMRACRNLREAITEAKGDFTDAERSEMEDAYRVLALALNK